MAAICCIWASSGGTSGWGKLGDRGASPISLTRLSKRAGPESTVKAWGTSFGTEKIRAGMRLYRLLTHVEGQLVLEDPEAFILSVMDVQHAPLAIGSEYLYQGVLPTVDL